MGALGAPGWEQTCLCSCCAVTCLPACPACLPRMPRRRPPGSCSGRPPTPNAWLPSLCPCARQSRVSKQQGAALWVASRRRAAHDAPACLTAPLLLESALGRPAAAASADPTPPPGLPWPASTANPQPSATALATPTSACGGWRAMSRMRPSPLPLRPLRRLPRLPPPPSAAPSWAGRKARRRWTAAGGSGTRGGAARRHPWAACATCVRCSAASPAAAAPPGPPLPAPPRTFLRGWARAWAAAPTGGRAFAVRLGGGARRRRTQCAPLTSCSTRLPPSPASTGCH